MGTSAGTCSAVTAAALYPAVMPESAPPSRRRDEAPPSPWRGEDGTMMLGAYERNADALWLAFLCSGCGRERLLGIMPGIARFGERATIGSIERRLRCSGCGGKRISAVVCPDTRAPETIKRLGPPPMTLADLAADG